MGQIVRQTPAPRRTGIGNWLMKWAWLFLGVFVVGAVALATSRTWVTRVSDRLSRRTGSSFVVGVLVLVVVPLLAALVALTIIGIPLALAIAALYLLAAVLSSVFVSFQTGGWLLTRGQRSTSAYPRLATGALVVSFLAMLPRIGWI